MRISFVIPVYNEEEVVKKTINDLNSVIDKLEGKYQCETVVVNDGSTDKTLEIVSNFKNIKLIDNPYNLGYGASLKRGIYQASGDWICIFDADGTYPIEEIPNMLSYMDSYDMVVGKRISEHDGTSWIRRVSKRFLNIFASWLTDFCIEDINSGMRVFKRNLCLEFWNLYPAGFSFTSTITIAFIRSNYFIKYVPIKYGKRVGESSIVPWDFFRFLTTIIKVVFYFRPWKIVGPIALATFISGVIKGVWDLYNYNSMGNLSILLLTLTFILILLSLFADLLFKERHII